MFGHVCVLKITEGGLFCEPPAARRAELFLISVSVCDLLSFTLNV